MRLARPSLLRASMRLARPSLLRASMRLARPLLLIPIALLLATCARETLTGTDLGADVAPDFTLADGLTGAPVTLSGLRGSVVALAFLYTRCPDVCPLTAEHFRSAQQQLGADADRVVFVAVSVDPDHDIPGSIREFSAAHRLERNWHFLIGPVSSLRSVWSTYGIRAEPDPSGPGVGHTDAIYLIDAKGRARVLIHTADGPDVLLTDLRILARER